MVAAVAPHQGASRRLWPVFEKRRIVELTMREGASIRAIAREHGVHPTSLSHWRRRYRAGTLGTQCRRRRELAPPQRTQPTDAATRPSPRKRARGLFETVDFAVKSLRTALVEMMKYHARGPMRTAMVILIVPGKVRVIPPLPPLR